MDLKALKVGQTEVFAHPVIHDIDGAKIQIFYLDHQPPHIHVTDTTGEEVVYDLNAVQLAPTNLPDTQIIPRAKIKKIKEWIKQNKDALAALWEQAKQGKKISKI